MTTSKAWQMPPLSDEVLLNIFDFLDVHATVSAMHVSRHWHQIASDPRLWRRLCQEQAYPKIDRRRYGHDWKRWYCCMLNRIQVDAFQNDFIGRPRRNDYSPLNVLVEPDATVLTLVRVIACRSMTPPHKIRLWRIDDFEDDVKGLVFLQDPTQKLMDAKITNGAAVLYELPDVRSGYVRPSFTSSLTEQRRETEVRGDHHHHHCANHHYTHHRNHNLLRSFRYRRLAPCLTAVQKEEDHIEEDRIEEEGISFEEEEDRFEEEEEEVGLGEEEKDDEDEELQCVLAISMAEMERRND